MIRPVTIVIWAVLSLVMSFVAYYIWYIIGWYSSDNQCEDEIEELNVIERKWNVKTAKWNATAIKSAG